MADTPEHYIDKVTGVEIKPEGRTVLIKFPMGLGGEVRVTPETARAYASALIYAGVLALARWTKSD